MSTEHPVSGTADSEKPAAPRHNILINRQFAWLACGQAISNIGDFVYSTTLLIWVYILGNSAAAVSGVLVAQYIPIFILGPLAGVFVDRWPHLRTMITSDLTRAVIALLPILAPLSLRLPTIYLSVFFISCISRFFTPALSGIQQTIVIDTEQPQAASISQVTQALAIIIGPALASPLYFTVGPFMAIGINAASYAISAFCIWSIRNTESSPQTHHTKQTSTTHTHISISSSIRDILHEMLEGLIFILRTRLLFVLITLSLVAMFGAGAINALDIVFAYQRLQATPALYGYLSAAGGIGALAGAICGGVLAKRLGSRSMTAGSLTGLGIGLSIYALQTHFLIAVIIVFLVCMPQGTLNIGIAPLFLLATPHNLIGRVSSFFSTVSYGASLLSIALAGYLGQFIPAYLLLLGGGLLVTTAGIIGWFALPAAPPKALEQTNHDQAVPTPAIE